VRSRPWRGALELPPLSPITGNDVTLNLDARDRDLLFPSLPVSDQLAREPGRLAWAGLWVGAASHLPTERSHSRGEAPPFAPHVLRKFHRHLARRQRRERWWAARPGAPAHEWPPSTQQLGRRWEAAVPPAPTGSEMVKGCRDTSTKGCVMLEQIAGRPTSTIVPHRERQAHAVENKDPSRPAHRARRLKKCA
jgi:hypothetical protein